MTTEQVLNVPRPALLREPGDGTSQYHTTMELYNMISISPNSNELNSREINWWEVGLRLMRISHLEEYLWDLSCLIHIAADSFGMSEDDMNDFLNQASLKEKQLFIDAGYSALQAIGIAVLTGALPMALSEDECDCPSDCEEQHS